MANIYRNVTGNLIMINETGTEIPEDAEFDIDDHPELERSPQFKRLVSMNFLVKVPSKRDDESKDNVKTLNAGSPTVVPVEVIRQIASEMSAEMGAVLKEALTQGVIDVESFAKQIGDHIIQNGGFMTDKEDAKKSMGMEIEAARAEMMNSAMRFQTDRPSVSVNEEVDGRDDLHSAANALKRTLQGGKDDDTK